MRPFVLTGVLKLSRKPLNFLSQVKPKKEYAHVSRNRNEGINQQTANIFISTLIFVQSFVANFVEVKERVRN